MVPSRFRHVVRGAIVAGSALGMALAAGPASAAGFFDGGATPSAGASLTNVQVAPGVTATSMSVTTSDGSGVTGSAQLQLGSSGMTISATFSYADEANWSFSAQPGNLPPYSPGAMPSLTLDPNAVSGTIAKAAGATKWSLTGPGFTWSPTGGYSLGVSSISISNTCPFQAGGTDDAAKCSDQPNPVYIGVAGAALNGGTGLTGGFTTDAKWMRFDGGRAGDVKAGPVTVANSQVAIWRGHRADAYDPEMRMPDLSALSGGVNIEYCGNFTLAPAKATNGCARMTPQGVALGQDGNGVASGPLSLAGVAWTNIKPGGALPTLPSVSFRGIAVALLTDARTVSATMSMNPKVAAALKSPPITFTLAGQVAKDGSGLTLSGSAPTKFTFGRASMQTTVSELTATIRIPKDKKWSMSGSATATSTVGGVSGVALKMSMTADATGMKIQGVSESAAGQSGTTTTSSGTTVVKAPKDPKTADYIWKNAYGIVGLHLYDLRTSIAVDMKTRKVSVGVQTTSYVDPSKFPGLLTGTDWIPSSGNRINASQANPCVLFGFDATGTNAGLRVKGGMFTGKKFSLGAAPNGCTLGDVTLPKGFLGVSFAGELGDQEFEIALAKDAEGYQGGVRLTNLELGGVKYPSAMLKVVNRAGTSEVFLDGEMTTEVGDFTLTSELSKSGSAMRVALEVTGADLDMGSSEFDLKEFGFKTSYEIPEKGCASFGGAVRGEAVVKKNTYTLEEASIAFSCDKLTKFVFAVTISHKEKFSNQTKRAKLLITWKDTTGTTESWSGYMSGDDFRGEKQDITFSKGFIGAVNLSSTREFNKKLAGKRMKRTVENGIFLTLAVYQAPGKSSWTTKIGGGGYFDADRISGTIGCVFTTEASGTDMECGGRLRVNPSWAGVYRFEWGEL